MVFFSTADGLRRAWSQGNKELRQNVHVASRQSVIGRHVMSMDFPSNENTHGFTFFFVRSLIYLKKNGYTISERQGWLFEKKRGHGNAAARIARPCWLGLTPQRTPTLPPTVMLDRSRSTYEPTQWSVSAVVRLGGHTPRVMSLMQIVMAHHSSW